MHNARQQQCVVGVLVDQLYALRPNVKFLCAVRARRILNDANFVFLAIDALRCARCV